MRHALSLSLTLSLLPSGGLAASETQAPPEEIPDLHERPILESGRPPSALGREDSRGNTQWFDMTDSLIDPERFQFGIGLDRIASIDEPEFVEADDPRLAQRGVTQDTRVLGVKLEGIARAYPVAVMSIHEVVNDDFAGKAYAVLW